MFRLRPAFADQHFHSENLGSGREPRLRAGGVHAPPRTRPEVSSRYGPQTNSRSASTARSNGKPLLTSRFAVGAEGLEPPASAL
jgi:hypothetical protein